MPFLKSTNKYGLYVCPTMFNWSAAVAEIEVADVKAGDYLVEVISRRVRPMDRTVLDGFILGTRRVIGETIRNNLGSEPAIN